MILRITGGEYMQVREERKGKREEEEEEKREREREREQRRYDT